MNIRDARRILVPRLDEIGDVVLTTPLLRELRRGVPRARITLVVKPEIVNLVETCPHVDEVIPYSGFLVGHPWKLLRALNAVRAFQFARRDLGGRTFDTAIVPRFDADPSGSVAIAFFCGARLRVGYTEHVTPEKRRANRGRDRFLTHAFSATGVKHEVERYLDLLRFLGLEVEDDRLEIHVTGEDRSWADREFADHRVASGDPLVAIAPGAGHRRRAWPVGRFGALAEQLLADHQLRPLLIGGPGDESLAAAIARRVGPSAIDVVGRATLRQTAALLERCRLFVGNDAGPMHLAVATGIPVVEISCHAENSSPMHANSPDRFGPWRVPHRVVRPETQVPPCGDGCDSPDAHCIEANQLEAVRDSVDELVEDFR